MHLPNLLQLQHPLRELLRRQIKPLSLVSDIMVLAKDAAQVAAAKEDATRAVMSCDARLFAKVRANDVHFDGGGTDKAMTGLLIAVDTTEAGAEVTIAEVGIGEGTLARGVDGGEEVVAGDVVVKEKGWG
jgi:hypothetical protein